MRTASYIEAAPAATSAGRQAQLRRLLEDRRREISDDLQERVKDARTSGFSAAAADVADLAELAEADVQGDLHFSLMQIKAETLGRIEQALIRIDSGEFGVCIECGDEIAERRLRALPFALRCKGCEEVRESRVRRWVAPPRFSAIKFEEH